MCLPASARTKVYAALWLFCGMFLKPTASVPSTVQEDNVPLDGVPRTGVVRVGLVASTTFPDPVAAVAAVPPLAIGKVPVTPVVNGKPVTLVITPDAGVPSAGVVSIGLVIAGLVIIDADFILLRGIVFSQRNCDYGLFITLILV